MRLHVHVHTSDEAPFDEAKHKRDGGKFSSTGGASASNAEHGEKAAVQAKAARTTRNPEKAAAHSEALGAWAEARKHLDPAKPMAEQSAAYKAALKKAEDLSKKADEFRKAPKEEPAADPAEGKAPADAPGSPRKGARPSGKGMTAQQALAALRRARNAARDPNDNAD